MNVYMAQEQADRIWGANRGIVQLPSWRPHVSREWIISIDGIEHAMNHSGEPVCHPACTVLKQQADERTAAVIREARERVAKGPPRIPVIDGEVVE